MSLPYALLAVLISLSKHRTRIFSKQGIFRVGKWICCAVKLGDCSCIRESRGAIARVTSEEASTGAKMRGIPANISLFVRL